MDVETDSGGREFRSKLRRGKAPGSALPRLFGKVDKLYEITFSLLLYTAETWIIKSDYCDRSEALGKWETFHRVTKERRDFHLT